MATLATCRLTVGFVGLNMEQVLARLAQVHEAREARLSGITSLSRGGTSTGFAHMTDAQLDGWERRCQLALNELDPTNYPHPGSGAISMRQVF